MSNKKNEWEGISFKEIKSIARDILDEAYNMKSVFGLPVAGLMYIEDLLLSNNIIHGQKDVGEFGYARSKSI